MILVIDNYDSFVYNLARYVTLLGAECHIVRNDAISVEAIAQLKPSHIILSPGPGAPKDAGVCLSVIDAYAKQVPILGVCLGHQAIGEAFGARVERASAPMHGKASLIHHDGEGLFENIISPFSAGRYHSLIVARESIPPALKITASTEAGCVMGLSHQRYPCHGVQFHPESLLTTEGSSLLNNFLRLSSSW